ncbi:efflux RND transporter periplasmic adaptor subunit [Halopseudomonas sabulinigri]|uniref:Efflux RND transporter periplasmic adaptor subunit n=1 Tax=Halopseudomonas sabulinigri TaxID=472181 RepID=A0ABP9ZRS3_9GAMM
MSAGKNLLLMCLLGLLAGCNQADDSEAEAAPEGAQPRLVLAAEVHPAANRGATFTGVVAARTESELGFRVAGKVIERRIDPGQRVNKGDVLLVLDVDDFELALRAANNRVRSAQASLQQARDDEKRYRELAEKGAVSRRAFDEVVTGLRVAEANMASARADAAQVENQRGYSTLSADADGVITDVLVDRGQVVAAGQVVTTLAHSGAREAVISIPETQRHLADHNAAAQLFGDPDTVIPAKLRELSAAADPITRTYRARYVLGDGEAPLAIGSTISIHLDDSASSALTRVPLGALYDRGQGVGVWVIEDASRVRFTPVTVASLGQEYALLSAGLEEGQQIVALGAHLLHEGDAVELLPPPSWAVDSAARTL